MRKRVKAPKKISISLDESGGWHQTLEVGERLLTKEVTLQEWEEMLYTCDVCSADLGAKPRRPRPF